MRAWLRGWLLGPVGSASQVPGGDRPALVSPELDGELARLARGVLALGRLDDLPQERRVLEVRRQLHAVAAEHDHPDLVPLLLLRMAEYVQVVQGWRDGGGV